MIRSLHLLVTGTLLLAPTGCGAAVLDSDGKRAATADDDPRPAALAHPKLSIHVAMQEIEELVAQCRTGKDEALLRVQTTFDFSRADAPFVESVDIQKDENLSTDELECVRETLMSMQVAPAKMDASLGWPTRFTPTVELTWDETGAMVQHDIRRGPLTDLLGHRKDGSDVRGAVAACQHDRETSVGARLTFEPITGRLVEVEVDPSVPLPTRQCVEQALLDTVRAEVRFEPRVPEDAVLSCTLTLGPRAATPTCQRLGPDGHYVEVPPSR